MKKLLFLLVAGFALSIISSECVQASIFAQKIGSCLGCIDQAFNQPKGFMGSPGKDSLSLAFQAESAVLADEPARRAAIQKNRLQKNHLKENDDPELQNVFDRIKKDMGLGKENIPLWVPSDLRSFELKNLGAYYYYRQLTPKMKEKTSLGILLSTNFIFPPSGLIFTMAHELTHYDQHNQVTGRSYNPSMIYNSYLLKVLLNIKQLILEMKNIETSAEAGAAMYIDCPVCLKAIADNRQSENSEKGKKCKKQGYFVREDYDLYIKRAQEEGKLCKAHQMEQDDPYFNAKLAYFDGKLPLSAFLPDPVTP